MEVDPIDVLLNRAGFVGVGVIIFAIVHTFSKWLDINIIPRDNI